MPLTGVESEPARLIGMCRAASIFLIVVSLAGFFLALWTGGLVVALHELLSAIGLASRNLDASPYPLGAWTLVIYVAGAVLGFFARRHPLAVGVAVLPLAIVALLYGGPITRVYGVLLVLAGAALIGIALRLRADPAGGVVH